MVEYSTVACTVEYSTVWWRIQKHGITVAGEHYTDDTVQIALYT